MKDKAIAAAASQIAEGDSAAITKVTPALSTPLSSHHIITKAIKWQNIIAIGIDNPEFYSYVCQQVVIEDSLKREMLRVVMATINSLSSQVS